MVKFFASYPGWAKVAMLVGVAITVGVAILAPRTPIDVEAQTKASPVGPSGKAVIFKVHGVNSAKLTGSALVRVTAIVNGKSFTYPSLGAVDWLEVSPTMSSQSFPIPAAVQYDIRFEMDVSGSPKYVSQETIQVTNLPHTGDYRLYLTKPASAGISRAATPSASIRFSLEATQ